MSIIIRLQNLPWAANALDIRQFFTGLQIPEGGVHIVGGELGDAFIAFSTDEDARQAFFRNDGKIKGVQIKLMLSSRTEMQRVIEQARTQSMAAFMLPSTPVVPIQTPAAIPPAAVLPAAVPQVMPAAVPEIHKDRDRDDSGSDRKKDRRRSRSKSRDRRDRSRDRRDRRHRDRSRSRSKSRDRRDRRRGRDRSRSRNRSRDKDSRSSRRDRPKSSIRDDKDTKKSVPDMWNNRPQSVQPSLEIIPPAGFDSGRNTMGSSHWNVNASAKPNVAANMAANIHPRGLNGFQAHQNVFGINNLPNNTAQVRSSRESWPPANPPSVRENLVRSPIDYPTPPLVAANVRGMSDTRFPLRESLSSVRNPRPGPNVQESTRSPIEDFRGSKRAAVDLRGDLRDEMNTKRGMRNLDPPAARGHKSRFDDSESPVNACIALEPFYDSYGDLRRFFTKLQINYRGIKVINDEFGHKTGICLVQFRDEANKNEALKMTGQNLNGNLVTIKHISDVDFDNAIDKYNPRMGPINNYEEQLANIRNIKTFLTNEPKIKDFLCLKVEDMPTFVKEQDILHIFSQHPIISLHLDYKPKGGNVAYVKFTSKEIAKLALEERSHHVIRSKPVTVKPCSDEEFAELTSQQAEAFETSKSVDLDTDCLNLTQLPIKTSDRDISDFFSDIGVIPLKIHLMSNNLGFTGQAYCEFDNTEEAAKALSKDGTALGPNTISVKPILRKDMENVLGNSLPHPGVTPGQALAPGTPLPPIKQETKKPEAVVPPFTEKVPTPLDSQSPDLKKEAELEEPEKLPKIEINEEKIEIKEETNEAKEKVITPPRPVLEPARDDRFRNDHHLNFEGPKREPFDEPRFDYYDKSEGPRREPFDEPRFDYYDESREYYDESRDYYDESRDYYDESRGHRGGFPGRGLGGNIRGPGGSRFDPRDEDGPRFAHRRLEADEDEERPGCTVYMNNVPYKAGTNEILEFFHGYNTTMNVSRRYNPNNTPSSEAKITFYNPQDARIAVTELNGKRIWGRQIFLTQQ